MFTGRKSVNGCILFKMKFFYSLYSSSVFKIPASPYSRMLFNKGLNAFRIRISYNCSTLTAGHLSGRDVKYFMFNTPVIFNRKCVSSTKWATCINELVYRRFLSSTSFLYKDNSNDESDTDFDSDTLEYSDPEYENLSRQWLHVHSSGHQLLVIQPYIKWGAAKKHNTTPDLQLAEAIALVDSLPKWTVVDKIIISLKGFQKKTFFGSGNYEMLRNKITKDKYITAVFISTQMLSGVQHRELESAFGVPVYDRYSVVMQILHEHAVTKEAKLQVAMAEIPYLWSRIRDVDVGSVDKHSGAAGAIGGPGETYVEVQKRSLTRRENKLRDMLQKLRGQRELLRNKRRKLEFPVVAVVGYTNAGKTSLIRALTGNLDLKPEDKLFATLDVTMHLGTLPCSLKVLYVDTIGFISDIPTNLIESFVATLEDAMLADVILHVRDISHPDTGAQAENVMTTLQGLRMNSELLQNVVVAGNKIDLLKTETPVDAENYIPVSATQNKGLTQLLEVIQETVLHSTGRQCMVIRVPMGGPESRWLYKAAAVVEATADPKDNQYLLMKVIISKTQLSKFRSYFA